MAVNEVTSVDVKTLTPFKRFIMTLGELPTSYLESMTYAELVMWFCNFLQEKVIPAVNNNADALQDVITYLETLDLQDEVDHKLDEMADDGTLQEIVADYLNSKAVFGFDTVADMKLATNFIDGSYARTLGYYAKNDGGSSLYKIREITNSDVVDEATIIALADNTLVAELIVDKELNIVAVGGKTDGTSTITALTNAMKTNTDTIYFPAGTYLIDDTITLNKNLKGNNALINIDRTNVDEFGIYYSANNKKIENLKFHIISSNKLFKIYESNNLEISNCKFTTATTGRTAGGILDLYTTNNNILIENCYFETHASTTGGIWVREGTTSGLTKNVCFNNCEFIGDTADETIGIWGWKGTVDNVSVNNSTITRPINGSVSNPHIISLGSEGITKNCGLDNCVLDIYQASNSIFHTSYTNDKNLYIRNCIVNTHMQSLNNSIVAIISSDSEGLVLDNCTFNLLNTTLNPDVGSSLLAKYKNSTFNGETQINLNIANLENCIINNKATSQVSGKCARSLFAKKCIFNDINRTGSSFVQTLSTNDKVDIEDTVLYYASDATPQTYFIFSDGTAYNTTAPLIIKDTMFKGSLYLNSSNISKGYVIGNYTNQSSLGTVSANLINKNNETSVNY